MFWRTLNLNITTIIIIFIYLYDVVVYSSVCIHKRRIVGKGFPIQHLVPIVDAHRTALTRRASEWVTSRTYIYIHTRIHAHLCVSGVDVTFSLRKQNQICSCIYRTWDIVAKTTDKHVFIYSWSLLLLSSIIWI